MSPELRYGLAAGFGLCLWILAEYALGFHTTRIAYGEYADFLSSIVPFLSIWLLLRRRERELGPHFGLTLGFFSGFICTLVTALVLYVFTVAYNLYLNPARIEYVLRFRVEEWRSAHVPEDEIRRQIAAYRAANTPLGLLLTVLGGATVLGTGITLLVTGFFLWERRKLRQLQPRA